MPDLAWLHRLDWVLASARYALCVFAGIEGDIDSSEPMEYRSSKVSHRGESLLRSSSGVSRLNGQCLRHSW